MISIICACNNKKTLEKYLLDSLKLQNPTQYELIVVDTVKRHFDSAAAALNYGVSISKGNILLFVHQDVYLLDSNFLLAVEEFNKHYEYGIAGVAGVEPTNNFKVYSSVFVGPQKEQSGTKNYTVKETYSLDECLFFINRNNFMGFDDLGKTWHFYAVDYSIKCHKKGYKVYLIPNEIYHLSPGWSLDYSYFNTLKVVGKKYKEEDYIKTCVWNFKNDWKLPMYCEYKKIQLFMRKIVNNIHK